MLRGVSTTIDQARERVLELLGPQPEHAFLVGHSLENDLKALRLRHPRVLDTAVLYPLRVHARGAPAKCSLRALTARHLKREIQQSEGGHHPIEDAVAALDLATLKLVNGLNFAMPNASWGSGFADMHDVLAGAGWACAAVGEEAELRLLHSAEGSSCWPCASDGEAVALGLREGGFERRVLWMCLRGAAEAHGQGAAARGAALMQLGQYVRQLAAQLPPNTLVMVLGTGAMAVEGQLTLQADGAKRPPGCVAFAVTRVRPTTAEAPASTKPSC